MAKGISVVWYSSVKRLGCCDLVEKNMLTCVILKPCEITNVIISLF